MKQVFSVRPPPATYEEALADKIIRLNCMEEMIRGQRTLLMKIADLCDMTIAEEEEARKFGSAMASGEFPDSYNSISSMVDEQGQTRVDDSLVQAHNPVQDAAPAMASSDKPNLGLSILSRKRATTSGKLPHMFCPFGPC